MQIICLKFYEVGVHFFLRKILDCERFSSNSYNWEESSDIKELSLEISEKVSTMYVGRLGLY